MDGLRHSRLECFTRVPAKFLLDDLTGIDGVSTIVTIPILDEADRSTP